MEFAERVGIDGIKAFKRLPEWLRRPRDINSLVPGKFNCWPLSQWMKNQHLIYDLMCVYIEKCRSCIRESSN